MRERFMTEEDTHSALVVAREKGRNLDVPTPREKGPGGLTRFIVKASSC